MTIRPVVSSFPRGPPRPAERKNRWAELRFGSWYQILRNDGYADYDRAQGTIVPLAGGAGRRNERAINPKDGMFYAVGSDGWGNYALEDGSLDRIRYQASLCPCEKVMAMKTGSN